MPSIICRCLRSDADCHQRHFRRYYCRLFRRHILHATRHASDALDARRRLLISAMPTRELDIAYAVTYTLMMITATIIFA